MLLEKLELENYGIYYQRSKFDLATTPERPIILVGGLNGAGKTTLFESLMVGLYGKTYLGRNASKKEYSEFVLSKMHRHGTVRADTASVTVSFRFHHKGEENTYEICRSWRREGASVSEELGIRKDGEPMSDIDESQWQSFIEGMLPLGLARLFFFDAEKISNMTRWDDLDNGEVKSSIETLLGSDLVDQLRSDLDLYMVRKSGKGADKQLEADYEKIRKEKDLLASEIEVMEAERDRKSSEIKSLTSEVGIKESKIAGSGAGYADIRGDLLRQKGMLEQEISSLEKSIQADLAGNAPFHLVLPMLEKIRERVDEGLGIKRQRDAALSLRDKIEGLRKDMSAGGFWPEGTDVQGASERVLGRLEAMAAPPQDAEFFDLSDGDAARILAKISDVSDGSDALRDTLVRYGRVLGHLEKTEVELARIPKDDEMGPKISAINSLHQEIGMLKSEVDHINQELSSKISYGRILSNKARSLVSSIQGSKTADGGVSLAARVQKALAEYSQNLRERKISELESNLLESTRSLLHKSHIKMIHIDRETLKIQVFEDGEDESPVYLKSMGEKQIVGTALLWAIAKTSGRSLPFVIDTPLGRLDGMHLSNLTERFYPHASHQMILLSTDREIGKDEYAKLADHTSRSYRITCDQSTSVTTLSEGYFGVEP